MNGVAPESVPEIDSSIRCASRAKTVSWSCAEAVDGAATKAAAAKAPASRAQEDLMDGVFFMILTDLISGEGEKPELLSNELDFAEEMAERKKKLGEATR